MATGATVLVVNNNQPFNSLRELIDYARQNPGKLFNASAGFGSAPHLAAVLFETVAGVKLTSVQYKGGGPAAQSLLGPKFRVTRERGRVMGSWAGAVLATVHPSAILRAPGDTRAAEQRAFVRDLTEAARWLARATSPRPSPARRPARRARTSLR